MIKKKKKTENSKNWWRCGRNEMLTLLPGGNVKDVDSGENGLAVPQKAQHRITMWLSSSAPRDIFKKLKPEAQTYTCTQIFIAALTQ